jgi:tRNA dimethylallyltransferase
MQVYDAAPILTAQPSEADRARAPHAAFACASPSERYSVGRWLEEIAPFNVKWELCGYRIIYVGGTGLYFDALTRGLSKVPDIPEPIRAYWRAQADEGADLHAALSERDPEMAARLRPSDPQRLLRALEVYDATGSSLAEWQNGRAPPHVPLQGRTAIVVAPPREALYARIDARFDAMLEAGALEEARAVMALGLDPALPFCRLLGLRPLIAHLAGECSLDEAATRAKTDSRRYAKRQLTWLRRFMADWAWVETPEEGLELFRSGWFVSS